MTISFHANTGNYHTRSSLSVLTFPGGERHIKGTPAENEIQRFAVINGADANDYIAAQMWAEVVHSYGQKAVIYIPYLPGARADRGTPFGAKIYADLINAIRADHVVCFDPHSPVMPGLIDNLTVVDSTRVVRRAVGGRSDTSYTGIIAPDKGAHDRAAAVAACLKLPVYTAGKTRNPDTGEISGFHCEPVPADGKYLVVDDICDGGGTFRGLAAVLGLPKEQLGLYVSHGIFSGNAAGLNDSFGEIITTDSHPGAHNEAVGARVIPLLPHIVGYIELAEMNGTPIHSNHALIGA